LKVIVVSNIGACFGLGVGAGLGIGISSGIGDGFLLVYMDLPCPLYFDTYSRTNTQF
jgi:hypothetical protein